MTEEFYKDGYDKGYKEAVNALCEEIKKAGIPDPDKEDWSEYSIDEIMRTVFIYMKEANDICVNDAINALCENIERNVKKVLTKKHWDYISENHINEQDGAHLEIKGKDFSENVIKFIGFLICVSDTLGKIVDKEMKKKDGS